MKSAALALGVAAVVWFVPPAVQRVRGLCPLRPDGVVAARALPSFSRKYANGCSQCHVAYPVLNDYGRRFLLGGFSTGGGDEVLKNKDGSFVTEKLFPWGVIVRSRPFDNAKGSVSNGANPAWAGASDASSGFKAQGVNDVDMFVAGGDAARNISWIAELDANAPGGFAPTTGDLQLGWHPYAWGNLLFTRKNFYAMDPYQTLSGMQSPTIAVRATDGGEPDQMGLSGNQMIEQTQTLAAYGTHERDGLGMLFYMGGASTGNNENRGATHKNANLRVAYDTLRGVMVGAFGTFGREQPANIPASGGATNNPVSHVEIVRTGLDTMVELGNFVGRGAFLYAYDSDPKSVGSGLVPPVGSKMTDRAAYAELMYVAKKAGNDAPFLVPTLRENWYTTYNGTRQFNFITAQLAHYFRDNVKGFVEWSVDTKTDLQGVPAVGAVRVLRGNRVTGQLEVGF